MPLLRAVLLVFLVAIASSAHAVVPTGPRILELMASTQPAPTPFVVNYVEKSETGPSTLALRVVSDGQGRARLDLQALDKDTTRTVLYRSVPTASSASSGVEGEPPVQGWQGVDHAPLWLQWWMGRAAAEIVAGAKVDLDSSSLAHADGTVLWVVGAGPRQAEVAQLQVERVTGRLRRAVSVVGQGEAAEVTTAHLDAYIARDGTETRFPARLTLSIAGRDVTFVNTWLRVGDAARVDPKELDPSASK